MAFVGSRPAELQSVKDFKLQSVHMAAAFARRQALYYAALADAYNGMVPVLDELCDAANQLLS